LLRGQAAAAGSHQQSLTPSPTGGPPIVAPQPGSIESNAASAGAVAGAEARERAKSQLVEAVIDFGDGKGPRHVMVPRSVIDQSAPGMMSGTPPVPGTPQQVGTPYVSPAAEAAFKAQAENDAKEVFETRTAAAAGNKDLALTQTIQDFLPKVQTGWGADTRLEGARILQAAGVDPNKIQSFLGIDPAAGQLLNKQFLQLSSAAVRNMGAREPGSVIQLFNKAYPNLETTDQTVKLQTNAIAMDRLRSNAEADAKAKYYSDSLNQNQANPTQYRSLNGFQTEFNQTHDPRYYLHAAEALSMAPEAWKGSSPEEQQHIYNLIPSGKHYIAGDGNEYIKR
jgi:hypothetical protein